MSANKKRPIAAKRPRTAGGGKTTAARAKTPAAAKPATAEPPLPKSLVELMTQALTMEIEAAQRYTEFADAMEIHNNREVAALFRKMADIESRHAQQIMLQMRWTSMPPPIVGSWEGYEPPENAAPDEVHYLMQPYHALEIALASEERAERFFAKLAGTTASAPVRKAARTLQAEEREHVRLVREWMKKVPLPDAEWAHDPDPPVYNE
jgi:rubrerythrin